MATKGMQVVALAVGLLGVGQAAHACQVAGNLVDNCGFPAGVGSEYTIENGTNCGHNGVGSSGSGSLQCDSVSTALNEQVRIFQCFSSAVAPSPPDYGYGADASLVSGSGVTCTVEASDWSGPSCSVNINGATTTLVPGAAPAFAQSLPATYTAGGAAATGGLRITCTATLGSPFQIRFDDLFFGAGLVPVELLAVGVE